MASDKDLGMHCRISRRDFVSGTAVAVGALGMSSVASAAGPGAAGAGPGPNYPPAKTGMRGSHRGSFEPAHMLRDGKLNIADVKNTGETYDCVVVGGGLSGLAAAHFYRKYASIASTPARPRGC